jgi:hypothetical protein
VTAQQTITDLEEAKALIAAGHTLLEVRFDYQDGERGRSTVPSTWIIERHEN